MTDESEQAVVHGFFHVGFAEADRLLWTERYYNRKTESAPLVAYSQSRPSQRLLSVDHRKPLFDASAVNRRGFKHGLQIFEID